MIRNFKDTEPMTPKQAIALLIAMILMSAFFSVPHAIAEMEEEDFDAADVVILNDPTFFLFDEDEYAIPVISSGEVKRRSGQIHHSRTAAGS